VVKISMKTITIVLTLFLSNMLFVNTVFAASKMNATIDKNPVVVNESFILKISIDDDIDTTH